MYFEPEKCYFQGNLQCFNQFWCELSNEILYPSSFYISLSNYVNRNTLMINKFRVMIFFNLCRIFFVKISSISNLKKKTRCGSINFISTRTSEWFWFQSKQKVVESQATVASTHIYTECLWASQQQQEWRKWVQV